MRIGRRRFIGFTAGAAAGAVVGATGGGALERLLASAESPVVPPRGPERFVLSVCDLCPGGCGIRVRRIGERAVKLDGNPTHPVNGGRLCPRGQAALQGLYHPDRAPGPLRRRGPRGSIGSFARASWDDAFEEIGARLRALRQAGRPESVALVRGSGGGLGPRVARRFLAAYGSPNDVLLHRGDEAASMALELTQGVRAAPAPDLAGADYVLSLGSALLEASSAPVHAMRAYGEFRQGRPGRRGKLVQVEPRLSITGASADEWIEVRPGTEGIFALGVAAAIVSEDRHAKEFVLERTSGFEESRGRPGLRALLEQSYGLDLVAAKTGVAVDMILRIAREFAGARAAVAVGPRKGPLLPGSLFGHLAASALNALVGNIDAPGGVLVADHVPLAPWPALPRNAGEVPARPRLDGAGEGKRALLGSDVEQLAEAILAGQPYGCEALLVLGADPAFASAAPGRFAAAIEKVPLVVSFATLADDTALLADWILPEAHFLERWDLHLTPPGVPYPLASLAQPGLERPLHDVRPAATVFLELARRTGPDVAAALPWKDDLALARAELDGLFRARRGAAMGTPFDEAWVRMMEGAGWWAPGYRTADELWQRSLESGGWWDPFYDHGDWKRVLRTPTGRCGLRADLLSPRDDPAPDAVAHEENTLALLLFEPLPVAGGSGAELPFLQAILDPGHPEGWETWAEIHPESAAHLGLRDGDRVQVESPHGSVMARARVGLRVVPGAVALPVGLGKHGGGRWARGVGANPLALLGPGRDPLSGLPDPGGVSVRVRRLSASEGS